MRNISKDTVVRLLTIIFTPVAGGLTAYLARNSINLPSADVVTVAVSGSAAVLGLGFHWLAKQPVVEKAESDVEAVAKRLAVEIGANPELKASIDGLASKLEAQTGAIVDALGKGAGVPAEVLSTLKAAIATLEGQPAVTITTTGQPPTTTGTVAGVTVNA